MQLLLHMQSAYIGIVNDWGGQLELKTQTKGDKMCFWGIINELTFA